MLLNTKQLQPVTAWVEQGTAEIAGRVHEWCLTPFHELWAPELLQPCFQKRLPIAPPTWQSQTGDHCTPWLALCVRCLLQPAIQWLPP